MKLTKIEKIIGSLEKLPTLPSIYSKLLDLTNNPDATVQMMSRIITEDQAIAAKVLRLANSAFYGFPQRIVSVQHAIVILGLNEIRNLILAISLLNLFRQQKSMKGLWEHSIGCAVAAKVLAEAAYVKNPEGVFAGGLLHDIGKLIHALYFPEEFADVIADIEKTGSTMIHSEKKIFGFNHTQTGNLLATNWNLPREIISMISHHHLSDPTVNLTLEIAAIHIGNTLCIALGLGSGGEKKVPIANQTAWETLGLKLSNLESFMVKTMKLFKESIEILGF